MTKRIFRSICIIVLSVFFASVVLFLGILYEYYSGVQRSQLRMQTYLAAQGVDHEGAAYFKNLDIKNCRITWIGTDGNVLYDNKSDSAGMENHLEREEIKEALSEGIGESARYSSTLMERSIYCAQRLSDGTVLRLSVTQNTLVTLLLGMIQPICIIFVAALVFALILAGRLSRGIMKPLNELNLDEPLKNDGYEELTPLLKRIAAQQRQIKKQEEELLQRQNEFEIVTTGMTEGIVLLNEKRIILGINPAAERLLNTDHSCVGKYLLSVNRSLELQEFLQKAENGNHVEMMMELSGRTYQFDASPVFSDGLVSGVALLILDVTEKEQAEQMRREFTANVSHELKTPLHTISGYAELLAKGMVKQEDVSRFSSRIYTETQRIIRLVEDILRLSHLDEGARDMKFEEVDLYDLTEKTMGLLTEEAQGAEVSMNLEGEHGTVYGVTQLLQGMIYNLCDNGIKYNRKGGSVLVTVKKEGSCVSLSVADTGIGIPPEHQERVFERFYRVDKSHSKEIGGTGLGLSIVKHGARLHQAEIEVHSTVGSGTVMILKFPQYTAGGRRSE